MKKQISSIKSGIHTIAFNDYGPWREGNLLVIRRLQSGDAAPLPHRCLKCNQPGKPLKKITYVWSNPLLLFLLFVPLGIFILLFGYFIYRKKIKMAPVLCERHQLRDKIALTIGSVGSLLSLILIFYAMIAHGIDSTTFFLGWIFLISSLIAVVILRPSLRPSKIDNEFARFRGCDKHYLNNLPPTLN